TCVMQPTGLRWLRLSTRAATRSGDAPFPRGAVRLIGKHPRDMAHFAAGADGRFAVEMHGGAGNLQPLAEIFHLVADEIDHFDAAVANGLAERPAGDRADMLLELRDRG